MKKNIILYLLVFMSLILIFQFVNSKKLVDDLQEKLSYSGVRNKKLKDSIFQLKLHLDENNDFNLDVNEYALRYFDKLSINNIASHVKDQLYETNLLRKKNSLIPYATMGRTFLINKVRVLNHQWIIADFSDGTHWGEIFLTYQIDKNGGLNFKLTEHFLYPNPD